MDLSPGSSRPPVREWIGRMVSVFTMRASLACGNQEKGAGAHGSRGGDAYWLYWRTVRHSNFEAKERNISSAGFVSSKEEKEERIKREQERTHVCPKYLYPTQLESRDRAGSAVSCRCVAGGDSESSCSGGADCGARSGTGTASSDGFEPHGYGSGGCP